VKNLNRVFRDPLNRYSQTIYSIQSSNSTTQIPLDGIPNDIYYLNVFYKGAILTKADFNKQVITPYEKGSVNTHLFY
jgi:hypothetical protein